MLQQLTTANYQFKRLLDVIVSVYSIFYSQ